MTEMNTLPTDNVASHKISTANSAISSGIKDLSEQVKNLDQNQNKLSHSRQNILKDINGQIDQLENLKAKLTKQETKKEIDTIKESTAKIELLEKNLSDFQKTLSVQSAQLKSYEKQFSKLNHMVNLTSS